VASAGPYASLHLAPDRYHASTPPLSFLQAGCPSCCPTNSIKALKAHDTDKWKMKNRYISANNGKWDQCKNHNLTMSDNNSKRITTWLTTQDIHKHNKYNPSFIWLSIIRLVLCITKSGNKIQQHSQHELQVGRATDCTLYTFTLPTRLILLTVCSSLVGWHFQHRSVIL